MLQSEALQDLHECAQNWSTGSTLFLTSQHTNMKLTNLPKSSLSVRKPVEEWKKSQNIGVKKLLLFVYFEKVKNNFKKTYVNSVFVCSFVTQLNKPPFHNMSPLRRNIANWTFPKFHHIHSIVFLFCLQTPKKSLSPIMQ